MNARRRSRRNRSRSGNAKGPSQTPKSKSKKGNKSGKSKAFDPAAFWGNREGLPEAPTDLKIASDANSMVRSLGPPPLGIHETAAVHYLGPIYDRAVMLASALGAAGDLIEPEELQHPNG